MARAPTSLLMKRSGVVGDVDPAGAGGGLARVIIPQVGDAAGRFRIAGIVGGRKTRWTRFNSRFETSPGPVKLLEPTIAANGRIRSARFFKSSLS